MNEERLAQLLKDLGGEEGFWKSSAEDGLRKVWAELMEAGVDPEVAASVIDNVWGMACEEYGG